jgi:DNA replication protein DnaC
LTEVVCEHCNGTSWKTVTKDGENVARKCDCQIEININKRAERANIPPRFFGAKLSGYFPDTENPQKAKTQTKAKKVAEKFIKDYPAIYENKGFMFQGGVGVGKTRILCSIGYQLIETKGIDVYYIDWNDLVREMRTGEGHATRDFTAIHQLINRMSEVELLLFDEVGASMVSQWVQDNIYYLFNHRYNNNKITICATNYFDRPKGVKKEFSSNQKEEELLKDRVGDRIRSRLFEMTTPIVIEGVDFRTK